MNKNETNNDAISRKKVLELLEKYFTELYYDHCEALIEDVENLPPLIENQIDLPKINEKVKVNNLFGTIIRIYPPNEYHSGRFTVLLHDKTRDSKSEFWFDDYGVSVIPCK